MDRLSTQDDVADEVRETLNRYAAAVSHASTRISTSDPRLIPSATLDALEAAAAQIGSALTSYESVADPTHLAGADAACEALLQGLGAVPVANLTPPAADAVQAFLEAIAALERRAAAATTKTEATVAATTDSLITTANDARARVDATAAAAKDQLEALSAQVAATQDDLAVSKASYDAELTAQKTRIDTFIQNGQSQLTALQGTTSSEALTQREELGKSFASAAESQHSTWESVFGALEKQIQIHLDFFDAQESVAKRILGAMAASQTGGTYLEESNQQRGQANKWRWLSFCVWLAAVAVAIWSAHEITSSVADASGSRLLAVSSARIAVAGIALSFALWVSSQSGHHRRREQEARTIASELTTLRPFLAELPDPELQKALTEAFERYFPGKPEQLAQSRRKL